MMGCRARKKKIFTFTNILHGVLRDNFTFRQLFIGWDENLFDKNLLHILKSCPMTGLNFMEIYNV
jgi:hypothetical protein